MDILFRQHLFTFIAFEHGNILAKNNHTGNKYRLPFENNIFFIKKAVKMDKVEEAGKVMKPITLTSPLKFSKDVRDKIAGMFIGVVLGDTLGAPHEFHRTSKHIKYTGKLEYKPFMYSQFQGRRELAIGQGTDDTEMTLALLRQLIIDEEFNRDNVALAYITWANSGVWMMGKNTRHILKGFKTLKTLQKRIDEIAALPEEERSKSNGPLMRATPLALLAIDEAAYAGGDTADGQVVEDTEITNLTTVNNECSNIYVRCLQLALRGYTAQEIWSDLWYKLISTGFDDEVAEVIDQVKKGEIRDIKINKGLCTHALWCALWVLYNFDFFLTESDPFSAIMEWVINSQLNEVAKEGPDTDTNAAIAGGLAGALLGYQKMITEVITKNNIDLIFNADIENGPTPRPSEYIIASNEDEFNELIDQALKVWQKHNPVPDLVPIGKKKKIILRKKPNIRSKVVNVKVAHIRPAYDNLQEWMADPQNVYIGRAGVVFITDDDKKQRFPKQASIWANPFKIDEQNDRETVLEKYRTYIEEKIAENPDLYDLNTLKGKTLGCWCKPEGCHGDILCEILNK